MVPYSVLYLHTVAIALRMPKKQLGFREGVKKHLLFTDMSVNGAKKGRDRRDSFMKN